MQITSGLLGASHPTANDEALDRCQRALTLKDRGDYDSAQKVMRPLWARVGERPEISGLHPSVAAEVLLCVGVLTRWIGSKNKVEGSQETAKNLITESITFYESIGDLKSVAAARVELACCYWREGGLDEARITLNAALQKLTTEGNTRARCSMKTLTYLTRSPTMPSEVHTIVSWRWCNESSPLRGNRWITSNEC